LTLLDAAENPRMTLVVLGEEDDMTLLLLYDAAGKVVRAVKP
jgi:hypothetical protein